MGGGGRAAAVAHDEDLAIAQSGIVQHSDDPLDQVNGQTSEGALKVVNVPTAVVHFSIPFHCVTAKSIISVDN
jgi:hypothetical protein